MLLALALRGLVAVGYGSLSPESWVPVAGETYAAAGTDGYIQLARTLWTDGRYAFSTDAPPVHHRPPVTPAIMLVFGAWAPAYWYVLWAAFTIALGGLLVWLGQRIAVLVDFTGRTRVVWLFGLAAHPLVVASARAPTYLPIAVIGLLLWVWAVVAAQAGRSQGTLPGLWGGLLALTHATFLPAVVLGPLALRGRARWAALAVGMVLVGGWAVRNQVVLGQAWPLFGGAGYQYWAAEEARGRASHFPATWSAVRTHPHYGTATPAQDEALRRAAVADIRAHPLRTVRQWASGCAQFWAPAEGTERQWGVGMLCWPLVGLWLWRLRRRSSFWFAEVALGLAWGVTALYYPRTGYCTAWLPIVGAAVLVRWRNP